MVLYLPVRNFFALYIEFNIDFGATPLFSKETFKGETIFYFPYGHLIYTPSRILKEKPENIHVAGHTKLQSPLAGTPEN